MPCQRAKAWTVGALAPECATPLGRAGLAKGKASAAAGAVASPAAGLVAWAEPWCIACAAKAQWVSKVVSVLPGKK